MKIHPLIAAALFALLAAPSALGADLKQVAVPTGDLDLHSAAGQTELKARVSNAASTLCQPEWITRSPDSEFSVHYRQVIYLACVGRLTNRAMASIGGQAGTVVQN